MGIEKASNEVIRHSEIGKQLFKDLKYESRYLIELINSLISRCK
jgi:hypothetical protein